MSPPGLHGFGMPPGQLMQMLRGLDQVQLQSLLNPFAGFDNQEADSDPHTRGRSDTRGRPEQHTHNGQLQSSQTQSSSAVYRNDAVNAAVFDGHDAADAFVNTLRELPGGVALLNALSRGSDAVPAGIARQLGEVAQQLTALAQNQAATQPNNAGKSYAASVAREVAGNSNLAALNGHPAPASASAANAANAANATNAASATTTLNAVPNAVANPGANNATLPSAVPQTVNTAQGLPVGARPELPTAALQQQQNAANNVLAFSGNPAVVAPQLAASVAAAQAQQAAQAAAQQSAQQAAMAPGNPVATGLQAPQANFVNPHAAIPQGTSIGRDGVMPLDNRNAVHLQRDAVAQGHTVAGTAHRNQRHVRLLPHRMHRWMAQMGLVKPETLWRDRAMDSEESHIQQWLFWLLAVVAYGSVGIFVLSLLPNGGGLLSEPSRPIASGLGLLCGAAAAVGAVWLKRKMRAPTS